MALKCLFFSGKKNAKITLWLGPSPPGPYSGNLISRAQSSQPTIFKIVITGVLNKHMLQQNATIIVKLCLSIIRAFLLMAKMN